MYYYGPNYPYGANTGYGYPTQNNGVGGWFALILVIFILLVIIGCGCPGFNMGRLRRVLTPSIIFPI